MGNNNQFHSCFCVGPRPGEPVCPCRMRNMVMKDGRWVETIDHGPADEINESDHRKLLKERFDQSWTD